MLYTFGIWVYELGIKLASLWSPKAKAFLDGRKNSFSNLPTGAIWMHCASLGEFEQGRPLLERIKAENPEQKILITFFSPSGYEHAKTKGIADDVRYLPLDYPKRMKKWTTALQAHCLLLVKYELWPELLKATQAVGTPIHLIAGRFSAKQKRLKWIKKSLQGITHFWVQDEASAKHLNNLGIKQVTVAGDSRFDRVYEHAKENKKLPLIAAFKGESKLVVMGSVWPSDFASDQKKLKHKLLIAPHNLKYTSHLQKRFNGLLYSQASLTNVTKANVLIIDNIGILANTYRYADIAYIGGAFDKGLHNVLEAAVYGCPIVFGPNYHNFPEATELIGLGGAHSINDPGKLKQVIDDLLKSNPKAIVSEYCTSKRGATQKMWQGIFDNSISLRR